MSGTFSAPIRIGGPNPKRQSLDGLAITNASGLAIGDNTGATTVSQEFYIYQATAVAGAQPFYMPGIGGTTYIGGAISIPNAGQAAAQVIATIPAGARLQNINLNLIQAPTAITGGTLNFAINGTTVGSINVGAGLGNGSIGWATTLAALRLIAYVGQSDAVLTAALAGTGIITGGILGEISVNYTAKNADGTIRAVGTGQSQ